MTRVKAHRAAVLATILATLFEIPPSQASDGVVELNQAAALAGGITPADSPGFPITIAASGSYVLTGDLTVTGLDTDGIVITSADVTLDLGGHTIQGGCPGDCTISGSGTGIFAAQGQSHVRNGRVRGFSNDGLEIASRSRAEKLTVESNGDAGVFGGTGVDVVGVIASRNSQGIDVGNYSKVRDCIAESNRSKGITVGRQSIVMNNVVRNNGTPTGTIASGIHVFDVALVLGNVVNANARIGVQISGTSFGSLVLENTFVGNGLDGLRTFGAASVERNTSNDNGGLGMTTANTASIEVSYRGNVINGNAAGTVPANQAIFGGNSCNGTATCP